MKNKDLTDLELMKTHVIPNVWDCTNFNNMKIFCGKPYHSQSEFPVGIKIQIQ